MTRTVFDNAMTAHVWAAQSQPRGQSHNGNLWFEGRAIYSYGTHYVAGYIAGGEDGRPAVYLWNADSSSMTTNGKHLPAVRWAIPGAGFPCASLTATAQELARAEACEDTARGRVVRLARYLESHAFAYWPGEAAAGAIFRAMGASEAEAARRARAGQVRFATARRKAKEREARAELDSNSRVAKSLARFSPESSGREARAKLAKAAGESGYWADRLESEVREEGREAFRAAKAARAKGWAAIARKAAAHHKAIRAELARFEAARARYQLRAAVRAWIHDVRTYPEDVARESAVHDPERRAEALARAAGELGDSLSRLAGCPFVRDGGPLAAQLKAEAGKAWEARDTLRAEASAARMAKQAEARAAWLAGGPRPSYQLGQLSDALGGALLRARDVARDESGAITGGTLETSWGASVPLAHAVRAFRFLKLCRDTGRSWAANGKTLHVGHFRVDAVDSQGNFRAGCHRINWAECARLADALGLADLAADDSALSLSRGAA